VGVVIVWLISRPISNDRPSITTGQVCVNLPQCRFINPSPFPYSAKSDDPHFTSLASSVSSYIKTAEKDGQADSVSVYIRDLDSGQWTGVNEDGLYTPSSMLKVVAIMAVLKPAETDPALLDVKVQYRNTPPGSAGYFDDQDILTDGNYTLRDMTPI